MDRVKNTIWAREYGAASFLQSKSNPISVNRVLLGMLAGFAETKPKTINEILLLLEKTKVVEDEENVLVDPILGITFANLLGVTADTFINKIKVGSSGIWNSSICHMDLLHNTTETLWVTMAELRGAIDGYNIGTKLKTILPTFPNITASQLLRFYYSKEGIFNIGICNRNVFFADIKYDVWKEIKKFLRIWNKIFFASQYDRSKTDAWITNDFVEKYEYLMDKAIIPNLGNYSFIFYINN